ncbi:hypothetical protein P168DRAFT_302930 [Aspergillus campestris IBT 28561]|uniref:T6SS Phospholipase effector Tle1-like catalytic domain-containing protein n=1 Tax=Aspergillus campestris (strain IBT 28561) TaxID=1392248 RepID=A0A2I1D9U6_ASPC2|nr:uncharacterized protein P168DRAFT_302930 [Aspergillus campestris IBT 28561]PKY06628.1 hypothetical protein P168DRAFT_302930 [Aspergillus campestris IBT 28561]
MAQSASLGPKQVVLCFDGTGNKFQGDESDSNVLKIFRMLDRSDPHQCHYYQPGIGTYVTTQSLSKPGHMQRVKSAYLKAKASAVGTTFADHVMGGYKFLMRYHNPGDDLYIFGFSRGAYVARFLAEMLDYMGLLELGNEELLRFVWKTFAQWQERTGDQKEKNEQFRYMAAFRETFSRPVTQIRFLGLFDTVNSVPRFENPWMQRSKTPYASRTSAKVIRHAVGIDERRAKFRQDLISEVKPQMQSRQSRIRAHMKRQARQLHSQFTPQYAQDDGDIEEVNYSLYRPSRRGARPRGAHSAQAEDEESTASVASINWDEDEEDDEQDLEEVWFPGAHADIGGGWKQNEGEGWALSHAPLVWMVQEAQRAGLRFKSSKLKKFQCWNGPIVAESLDTEMKTRANERAADVGGVAENPTQDHSRDDKFNEALRRSSSAKLHDCLKLGDGLPVTSVLSWKMMEYLPFRRMDLQGDGTWKPIRWPLPRGEVRDMPQDAQVHVSVIRRMQDNPEYRPGNLIVGRGGRGVRKAPKDYGMGRWDVSRYAGCPVRETYMRQDVVAAS